MLSYKAIYVIVLREFKRFFRQKGRLLVTISRPLIWLVIVGAGFMNIVELDKPINYIQYIVPGILGMTILFSSIFSSISVVWDREFGFLREMLVAPVSRLTIVIGKLVSGTLLSVFQALMLLVIVIPFLHIRISFSEILLLLFLITLVSLSITSFGLFIAAHLDSLEGFNVIMNFIVLPMFFLSGALYPISTLPDFISFFAYINPLCYGVDSLRHVLYVGESNMGAELSLVTDIIYISVFSVIMIILAARAFARSE